jgi:isocitrate dehydrogenase kinase/phosphatase
MTFIVAIQLNDSIIVTADNKKIALKETGEIQFNNKNSQKIYSWDNGIITGTGESYVISRSIELFKKLTHADINTLPQWLDISRQIRELEIGTGYFQVENSKILCSCYSENGAQLYKIERFDNTQAYTLTAIKPMNITVWMFDPNIELISTDLQNLYTDLKDYAAFSNQTEWINYYINRLAPIYQKQSQQDLLMSQSFDFFFQAKSEYIIGHVPNTQNSTLEFKEISSNFESI